MYYVIACYRGLTVIGFIDSYTRNAVRKINIKLKSI